jgi:hypothetical protein
MAGKQVAFTYNGKARIGTVIIDAADYIKLDCGTEGFRNFTKSKIENLKDISILFISPRD